MAAACSFRWPTPASKTRQAFGDGCRQRKLRAAQSLAVRGVKPAGALPYSARLRHDPIAVEMEDEVHVHAEVSRNPARSSEFSVCRSTATNSDRTVLVRSGKNTELRALARVAQLLLLH